MQASKFQQAQAPLKERYKRDAKAAFLTLRAEGTPGKDTITCKVQTGRGLALAGIHPKAGGSGLDLCSGDMLLEALVACAGVSLSAAATMLGVTLRSAKVFAEGDVDLRGTLGISDDVPVGFTDIRLRFDIDADVSKEVREQLLALVERYCVVFQTLQRPARTEVSMNVLRKAA